VWHGSIEQEHQVKGCEVHRAAEEGGDELGSELQS
jgi:hypothetical protein